MAYSTEELLLAAKVRELALSYRDQEFEIASAGFDSSYAELAEWRAEWRRINPIDKFMLAALNHIKSTADFIAQHG